MSNAPVKPHAVIDARSEFSQTRIFSMTLVERILRQLDNLGVEKAIVAIRPNSSFSLRKDFKPQFKIHVNVMQTTEDVDTIVRSERTGVVVLDGDGLYDDRILDKLVHANTSLAIRSTSEQGLLALYVDKQGVENWRRGEDSTDSVNVEDMHTYVRFLRKDVPPVFMKVDAAKQPGILENLLYDRTFKGSMEFVAAYGYRLPVREMTKWVAATRITPNQITGLAVLCSVAAIPCFWAGWLWAGLILAATFIVLDSLDGKLARLTFRLSHVADRVDHLTSLPTRMGWYSGLGWTFSGGNWQSPEGIGGILLTLLPFLDKMNLNLCNWKFGRSLLDFTPMDRQVHLFTVRRNDIFVMLIGNATGLASQSYYAIVAWMILTWVWHSGRLMWIWLTSTLTSMRARKSNFYL